MLVVMMLFIELPVRGRRTVLKVIDVILEIVGDFQGLASKNDCSFYLRVYEEILLPGLDRGR